MSNFIFFIEILLIFIQSYIPLINELEYVYEYNKIYARTNSIFHKTKVSNVFR